MAKYFKRFGNWFEALPRPYQWLLFVAITGLTWLLAERSGYTVGQALYRVLH